MSKVYVFECNGLYKIGVTSNVNRRLKQLQTGNGFKITEVASYEFFSMAHCIERDLHSKFKECNTLGEWFNLSEFELGTLKLCLKFEREKLELVGCRGAQKIYADLYTKAISSPQGYKEVLVEIANYKFPVEESSSHEG